MVSHDTHALTVEASKTDDDVLCKIALHFEELTIVHHCANHFIHVVCHIGVVGDDFVEECFFAIDGVCAFHARSAFAVVLGEERKQTADKTCEFFFSLCTEMCYTALLGVDTCTAKFFLCHLFARHRLHHFGTREEHVAHALEHHDEVGQSRRVNSTTSARAADTRNLRHHTRSFDVALENVGKTSQSVDAFLDTSTTRVIQSDAGCAHLHSEILHFADLLSHGLGERTAIDCEILRIEIHQTAVDGGTTTHHAVTVEVFLFHAEVVAAM